MPSDNTGQSNGTVSRRKLIQTTGLATAVALAGCSSNNGSSNTDTSSGGTTAGGNGTSGSKKGGTLTIDQSGAPPDWDPVKGLGVPSAIVGNKFFSRLYTHDPDLKLVPDELADGLPEVEKGGQRYVVKIVDNAKFHNGDPVTADDVIYSFQAPMKEGSWVASSWNMITKFEKIDDTTVQFDLDYVYGAFPGSLGSMQIIPKAVREADKKKFATKPVGSGPFKLDSWKQNEFAQLVRWDEYWGDLDPNLDAVKFVPISETTSRVTDFKQKADVMQDIPAKLYGTVKSIKNSQIEEKLALSYQFLTFNLKEGETTKLKVRQAIDYCFSMDDVVDKFVKPVGVRQYQPVPIPTAKAWNMPIDEFKSMAHGKDIDKAKQLFEDADVPSKWQCKLMVSNNNTKNVNMCVSIANGIKEAGYDATVERLDWGTFLEKFTSGKKRDYNVYTLGWSVSPDPDYQMYNMYHISGAGANQGHYWDDEEMMKKIEQARKSTDHAKRRKLYIEIQKAIIEQHVQIPGWNPKSEWAIKNSVKDFLQSSIPDQNPQITTQWNNVWVDR